MVKYPSHKGPALRAVLYDTFLSVDFSRAPAHVKNYNSPNCVNMIRDEYGKVRRRTGYFKRFSYAKGPVLGITRWDGDYIVHSGDCLWRTAAGEEGQTDTLLYSGMGDRLSHFYRYDKKLYIMDGDNILCYDGESCRLIEGKVPRVIIAGAPSGGGVAYEQVNLICDKWEQSFAGTGSDKKYQLAFGGLDQSPVTVRSARIESGEILWDELIENTHFSVNRELGVVTFNSAPSPPVINQEDNIIITASKDRSEGRQRIFSSAVFLPFGINGQENQLFAAGGAERPNEIYWSAIGDMSYWGDLQYAVLGSDDSAIMALNTLNHQMIAHKDEKSAKSYLCSVGLMTINGLMVPQLTVDKAVSGSGCIARHVAANFGEPLFLSRLGVQAITWRDLSMQEMETLRGERINRRLMAEPNIEKAICCVWGYFFLIGINGHVYILDRLSPQSEGGVLSNAYQYNGFYWDNVPASCFFAEEGRLMFGTDSGHVMEFYGDEASPASYNDDGESFEWVWELPEYVGGLFYSSKAIRYIALRAKAYVRTSVAVDVQIEGVWYEVLRDDVSFGYLDFDDIDFNNLSLSTDYTPKKTAVKLSHRGMDKLAFRIRGDTINQPFGLYSFAFEVRERGRHKG